MVSIESLCPQRERSLSRHGHVKRVASIRTIRAFGDHSNKSVTEKLMGPRGFGLPDSRVGFGSEGYERELYVSQLSAVHHNGLIRRMIL